MVIKKLILNNFGVYAGRNVFDFVHQKPIVLIGGMNGRGKTTFLEAILLALYGSNSVAFKESKYKAYSRYLEAHMNRNSLDQTAFIELEFYENKGAKQKYSIRREWNVDTKRATETIVAKENDLYSDFLTKNWAMFVENLLPNALSGFYFFDGEKIADMAVDETNAQLKDSIRSMLGIGVLDVLRILETVGALQKEGFEAALVKPDATGRVSVQKILNEVTEHTLVVSLMHVNNETGIIQPVEQLGNALEERKVLFYVDATQSCGKLVEEIRTMKYDMLSFSAHKLGGPQGVGVLVLRKKNYKFPPVKAIMYGGPQEHGIRPGTVPVALVAGCGKACEIAEQECVQRTEKLKVLKNLVVQMLDESGLNFTINGDQNYCMDNTLNVCLHGISSEALMISTKQYCGISNGSACTSKSYSPSYVLLAMGVPVEQIENSVRISWGADTDPILLKAKFSEMLSIAKKLAQ